MPVLTLFPKPIEIRPAALQQLVYPDLLSCSEREIGDGLADFEQAIHRCEDPGIACALARRIGRIVQQAQAVESLALNRADALTGEK